MTAVRTVDSDAAWRRTRSSRWTAKSGYSFSYLLSAPRILLYGLLILMSCVAGCSSSRTSAFGISNTQLGTYGYTLVYRRPGLAREHGGFGFTRYSYASINFRGQKEVYTIDDFVNLETGGRSIPLATADVRYVDCVVIVKLMAKNLEDESIVNLLNGTYSIGKEHP